MIMYLGPTLCILGGMFFSIMSGAAIERGSESDEVAAKIALLVSAGFHATGAALLLAANGCPQ